MSKYALIKLLGKQYKVKEGDVIQTDRVEGETLTITDVLMINDGKKITVGSPEIKNSKVQLKVIKNYKGKKIRVGKFRAKSRYRKVKGHRQHLSSLEVVKIFA
jgi:large subunit ribosomal protein L21